MEQNKLVNICSNSIQHTVAYQKTWKKYLLKTLIWEKFNLKVFAVQKRIKFYVNVKPASVYNDSYFSFSLHIHMLETILVFRAKYLYFQNTEIKTSQRIRFVKKPRVTVHIQFDGAVLVFHALIGIQTVTIHYSSKLHTTPYKTSIRYHIQTNKFRNATDSLLTYTSFFSFIIQVCKQLVIALDSTFIATFSVSEK